MNETCIRRIKKEDLGSRVERTMRSRAESFDVNIVLSLKPSEKALQAISRGVKMVLSCESQEEEPCIHEEPGV